MRNPCAVVYEDQRLTFRSCFSLSTMWILGLELMCSGFVASNFTHCVTLPVHLPSFINCINLLVEHSGILSSLPQDTFALSILPHKKL